MACHLCGAVTHEDVSMIATDIVKTIGGFWMLPRDEWDLYAADNGVCTFMKKGSIQ